MAESTLHYDAFISYRHSELDKAVASGMLRRLESFRLPSSLGRNLPQEKRRITRIFRDQDELPLSSNLSDPIEEALLHSDFLIVICSPRLPESKWCAREIARFTELHGKDRIITLLVEGDTELSVPSAAVSDPDHPVCADVRADDPRTLEKNMDAAVFPIAARMLGVDESELRQRTREQRVRRTLAASLAAAAALLLFGLYCISQFILIRNQNETITVQKEELEEAYTEQQRSNARSMARIAGDMLSRGLKKDAVYGLVNAMPSGPDDDSVPYEPSAERALAKALSVYETDMFIPERAEPFDPSVEMDDSYDYDWFSITDRYEWWPWDWSDIEEYVPGHIIVYACQLSDGTILIVGSDGALHKFDPESGFLDSYPLFMYSSPPGDEVIWAKFDEQTKSLSILTTEREFINYQSDSDSKVICCWKGSDSAEYAGEAPFSDILDHRGEPIPRGESALSADGRYRLLVNSLGALEISPAGSAAISPLLILDEPGYYFCGMEPLGDTGRYAVIATGKDELSDAFILNSSLEIIAVVERYFGYDAERNGFLQYCYADQADRFDPRHNAPLKLVFLPMLSYDELMQEADRLLMGYVPSTDILERYKMLK